mgnify:FL=1
MGMSYIRTYCFRMLSNIVSAARAGSVAWRCGCSARLRRGCGWERCVGEASSRERLALRGGAGAPGLRATHLDLGGGR